MDTAEWFRGPKKPKPNGHDLLAGLNNTLNEYKASALARAEEAAIERERILAQLEEHEKEREAINAVVSKVDSLQK